MKYLDYMKKYHTEHYCCPVCHSKNYSATLCGFAYDENHPEDYKDWNDCQCYTCGWHGVIHELAPKPEKTAFRIAFLDENDLCHNYDNELYTKDEVLKIVEDLRNNGEERYYYCYEVEIYQDIR